MKKYIAASILLVAIVSIAFVFTNKKEDEMTICHSEIVWIKENGTPDGIILKSKMSLQIADNHSGRMNFYGYIKEQDTVYCLDRAVYFEYNPVDNKGHFAIRFKSSSIMTSDNTPNNIFSTFFNVDREKINYYIQVKKMEDNIYILKDEAYTSFTCFIE